MHVLRKREPAVVLNYWHFITVPSQWLKDTVINKNQNEDTDINLHTNGRTDLNRKFSVEKKISSVWDTLKEIYNVHRYHGNANKNFFEILSYICKNG